MTNLHDSNNPAKNIMVLNDDCLLNIIRRLSRPDRIHFAQTCSRFLGLYHQLSQALDKYVNLDDFEGMTSMDINLFLKLSGQHVRKIERTDSRDLYKLWECLGAYCINLESFGIYSSILTVHDMRKIFQKLNKLQFLELDSCELTDDSLLELRHLSQLKKLNLYENCQLTGLNMNHLPASLESLNLSCCFKVRLGLLPQICKALPNLKKLNIEGIAESTDFNFQHLVSENCCDSLETLTITTRYEEDYEHIAKLPSLKNLILSPDIESYKQLRSELLLMLVEHKSQQLHHLEIRSLCCMDSGIMNQIGKLSVLRTLILPEDDTVCKHELMELRNLQQLEEIDIRDCYNVTNNAVLQLILACPKLKVLHLEYCDQLTQNLLSEIVSKLRSSKRDQSALPIKIYMNRSFKENINLNLAHKGIIELKNYFTFDDSGTNF